MYQLKLRKRLKKKNGSAMERLGISLSQAHNPPLFVVPVGQAEPAVPRLYRYIMALYKQENRSSCQLGRSCKRRTYDREHLVQTPKQINKFSA